MNEVEDRPPEGGPAQLRRTRLRRKDPLGPDSDIGVKLRALYAEVEGEPLPVQLIDLLEQLDRAERRSRE